MRIEATCDNCARTFLLSQISDESDTPGRCPYCGIHYARHYLQVLVETVKAAEVAAGNFVHVLGRLESMETGFNIDTDGLLRKVADEIAFSSKQGAAS